jgi:chemotaxis protein CheC
MDQEVDNLTIDALKEISNIAVGHLSEVISQLTGKAMSIHVPKANIVNVKDASDRKWTTIIVGYMRVFGDVTGSIVFLLPKKDAMGLTELTLSDDVNPLLFPSVLEKDTLGELFTITGGAYLNAITQFLEIFFAPSAPIVSSFGAFNLLNYLKTRTGAMEEYESKKIVSVSVKFTVEGTDIKGEIIMLVGPTILDYLKNAIKEKHG